MFIRLLSSYKSTFITYISKKFKNFVLVVFINICKILIYFILILI